MSYLQHWASQARLVHCNKRILELAKLGRVAEARIMFDEMPHRDAVSWNSMTAAYLQNDRLKEADSLFDAFQGKNV